MFSLVYPIVTTRKKFERLCASGWFAGEEPFPGAQYWYDEETGDWDWERPYVYFKTGEKKTVTNEDGEEVETGFDEYDWEYCGFPGQRAYW